jgi:O-antigen/teichoic acid export membrane protein
LASPILIHFLPQNYIGVVNLIPACMLFPVFYTISETTVVGINISRKTKHSIVITVLPLITNVLLSIALVPIYGAGGAAVSVASAFLFYLILRTEMSRKLWQKFKVGKLYITVVLMLVTSAYPSLLQETLPWWTNILLIFFILILYKSRLTNAFSDFRTLKNA